ncbi:MAG: lysophospholipid acyltransferase family protein [Phycisphaerales bacterium]
MPISLALIPMPVQLLFIGLMLAWVGVFIGIRVLNRYAVRTVTDENGRTALGAAGLIWIIRVYTRFWHRLEVIGVDHVPDLGLRHDVKGKPIGDGRPVVLVSNHTAGIDPLLIQAALPFEPRWMMAADMRIPLLEPLWQYVRIIFVDRNKRDASSLREAIRHLQSGGCLGVFIEGQIAKPPRHLLPFKEGTGLLIRKTGAIVLPVIIQGTPQAETAWGSLTRRSRSKVRFLEPLDYTQGELAKLDGSGITADLHRRYQRITGWPDAPMKSGSPGDDTGAGESATLDA